MKKTKGESEALLIASLSALLNNSKYLYRASSGFCAHKPPETSKVSRRVVRYFIISFNNYSTTLQPILAKNV
jgi:hypothetical protein